MIASSRSSILLLLIALISSAPGSISAYNIGNIGTIISRTFSSSSSQSQLQSSTRTATRNHKSSTIKIRKTTEEEQDNVDTYLDFLDKRYRRVHARQQIQNQQNTQQQQQKSTASQPFSAMEWLLSGRTTPVASNSDSSTETAATIIPGLLPEDEEEDALYVLGVAGLASQKYLQAHKSYLSYLKKNKKPPLESIDGSPLVIESEDDYGTQRKKRSAALTMKVFLIGKLLVPVLRVLYAVDRRKQLAKTFVQTQVTSTVQRVVAYNRPITQSIVPSITKILFGSGTTWKRNNLVRTIAFGYATLMFFRYYLWNSTASL